MKKTFLTILVCLLPSLAEAAECRPGQINGRWALYSSISGAWEECEITVRQSRNVSGRCRQFHFDWFSISGQLTLSRSCRLIGFIREPPSSGSFDETVIGTLQGDGQSGAGNLIDRPGNILNNVGAHFSLIRRP
jgi:hypothetical protein